MDPNALMAQMLLDRQSDIEQLRASVRELEAENHVLREALEAEASESAHLRAAATTVPPCEHVTPDDTSGTPSASSMTCAADSEQPCSSAAPEQAPSLPSDPDSDS